MEGAAAPPARVETRAQSDRLHRRYGHQRLREKAVEPQCPLGKAADSGRQAPDRHLNLAANRVPILLRRVDGFAHPLSHRLIRTADVGA